MANRTYLPSITLDRTFEDYPLYYSDKGLYESALTSMVDVFEQALSQFDIALATRLDLFLPEDHQDTDLSILNDYFKLLKEKLNTDSLFYVWRKREDKVPSHNYRVMLFSDYSQHFGPAICWDKRNELVDHLKGAWKEAIEKHYKGKERSIILFNDRGNDGLGTRCKSKDTNIKRCVFHRLSSFAEAWKEERYCFGSSLD
ncbi:inovirus Gp2 family protein [Vibrio fluvialis]|uniref:inovirus Gp2 family protein n=1 Tax=Vibrio fluvialis TaxID=676 RepID=UPI00155902FB|nr:inovirus Gp2 family protein [Vibrio fluvialis]